MSIGPPPPGNEATGASVFRIAKAKADDPGLHKRLGRTASRSAYRIMSKMGLRWDIPISEVVFHTDVGLELNIPYIKPSDALTYILRNRPEVVLGGFTSLPAGADLLHGFWKIYREYHGSHRVFNDYGESLQYCLPFFLYGDEGRGRRRGNTSVFVLESPFGVGSAETAQTKKRSCACSCSPEESSTKKFRASDGGAIPVNNSCYALHNYKENSFLTRFLLFALPCSTYKAFPDLIPFLLDLIAKDLKRLYFEGIDVCGRVFTPVILGLKADIKYHAYVGNFSRWYSRMGRVRDNHNCHECLAGGPGRPFEDIDDHPSWEATMFVQRPWPQNSEPPLSQIPYDRNAPERLYKRDPFHTCKMGLFRHLAASTLAVCILWGYFNDMESHEGNSIPILIQRAYGHFRLWVCTFKKTPALRSFSKALMCWPNLSTCPWFNVKGSDCMLIVRWLCDYIGQVLLSPEKPAHVPVLTVMRKTLQAANQSFDSMNSHRLLLERRCAIYVYEQMTMVLNGYAWLARWCLDNDIAAFAMIYKVHAWKHEALDLFQALKDMDRRYFQNPLVHSCEINEDVVGRVSRLSRKVDSRLMERRCLQNYYSKCHFLHKRAFPDRHKA